MRRRNFSYLRGKAAQNSAKYIARPTDTTFKAPEKPQEEPKAVKFEVDASLGQVEADKDRQSH